MALPPCMSEDGRPAVFVGTMLQTGEAFALCDECLVMWSAALLQQMTGVDATPFIAAVSDDPAEPGVVEDAPGSAGPGAVDPTAAGGSTDTPPAPAPADTDDDPPIGRTKAGYTVGRSRNGSSDPPMGTGGEADPAAAATTRKRPTQR